MIFDFQSQTIRVDESADQRTYTVGPCKNAAAYRTVLLTDSEGKEALRMLQQFLNGIQAKSDFVFHSRNGAPLSETNVLVDGLHPALKSAGLPKAGMHAFRHGCNRRWELAGMDRHHSPVHGSQFAMTAHHTGEIPLEMVRVVTCCDPRQIEAVA